MTFSKNSDPRCSAYGLGPAHGFGDRQQRFLVARRRRRGAPEVGGIHGGSHRELRGCLEKTLGKYHGELTGNELFPYLINVTNSTNHFYHFWVPLFMEIPILTGAFHAGNGWEWGLMGL